MKDKARQMKVFTPEFNAALIITLVFTVGTYFLIPPFSWVMVLNDHFKAAAIESPTVRLVAAGLPDTTPPGTGNLTLADICARYSLDLKRIERGLKLKGIAASAEVTLKKIAAQSQASPTDVYAAIQAIASR